MKTQAVKLAILVTIAITFLLIGSSLAGKDNALHKTTSENLSTAMHGEAFAFAKYMLYAEHARKSGNPELAQLFENAAKTERLEHFAEEARLAGLVGNDAENLKSAFEGESYEVETMYREFAEKASSAGDKDAAERFQEIRRDEMKHRDSFQAALGNLTKTSGKQKQ